MADDYNKITFYDVNVIRGLPNWNILYDAHIDANDQLVINDGGYAGVDLSYDYANGLYASNYRYIYLKTNYSPNAASNYSDNLKVVIVGTYTDNSGETIQLYHTVNFNKLESDAVSETEYEMGQTIAMDGFMFSSMAVYIYNNTGDEITVSQCIMYRSQDISGNQVGNSIGFRIALEEVVAYLNGCTVKYVDQDKLDKFWWLDDANQEFAGVNVNNERQIRFSRKNEILID